MFRKPILVACLVGVSFALNGLIQPTPVPVTIRVDLTKEKGPLKPIWAWFGYDEPNYTYMKDGKKLLTELSNLSKVPVATPSGIGKTTPTAMISGPNEPINSCSTSGTSRKITTKTTDKGWTIIRSA